jgi:hypothetical protein
MACSKGYLRVTNVASICAVNEFLVAYHPRCCRHQRTERKQMSKGKNNDEAPLRLREALAVIKNKYPWVSVTTLRERIRTGEIKSKRSGGSDRSWYFVKVSDIEAALGENK